MILSNVTSRGRELDWSGHVAPFGLHEDVVIPGLDIFCESGIFSIPLWLTGCSGKGVTDPRRGVSQRLELGKVLRSKE